MNSFSAGKMCVATLTVFLITYLYFFGSHYFMKFTWAKSIFHSYVAEQISLASKEDSQTLT